MIDAALMIGEPTAGVALTMGFVQVRLEVVAININNIAAFVRA